MVIILSMQYKHGISVSVSGTLIIKKKSINNAPPVGIVINHNNIGKKPIISFYSEGHRKCNISCVDCKDFEKKINYGKLHNKI